MTNPPHRFVDDSHFPLVITDLPEHPTADDFTSLLARHADILARQERYVTITDLSRIRAVPGADQRRVIAEWNRTHDEAMRRYNIGSALVVRSKLVRGALTALSWLSPNPTPWVNVATRAEALQWSITMLQRNGLTVPASVNALDSGASPRL